MAVIDPRDRHVTDPRVGAFDGTAHLRTVAAFAAADRDHIGSTAVRVRRAVAENATRARDAYPRESDVIEHQARLKRGHLPIRQLFQAAPHVLGALRPCWAMSPLVVAPLLPLGRWFNVVIFDEASQITPADAMGALMRADRAVVAGDPHQLPPTSFFASSADAEEDDEAETPGLLAGTRNMESILDVMGVQLRARHAGRVVVLTADHGHVIERRQGTQRTYAAISSGRSRAAAGPTGDGEVLVTGRRVLPEGTAVLAVDETLRYGPLKAGYHGGAAPAEAVVPVVVLVPGGAIPADTDLRLAPPQEPAWWLDPLDTPGPSRTPASTQAATPEPSRPAPAFRRRPQEVAPTLFDQPETEPAQLRSPLATQVSTAASAVLKSPTYAAQKRVAGRVSVSDDQVRGLLGALLAAPSRRLSPAAAAAALQVSPVTLRGAVLHVQRLLNVEGYPVLRVDADGATLILDDDLLREQFGIGP